MSAPLRSAYLRIAPLRSASLRFAPIRFAPLRSALSPLGSFSNHILCLFRIELSLRLEIVMRLSISYSFRCQTKIKEREYMVPSPIIQCVNFANYFQEFSQRVSLNFFFSLSALLIARSIPERDLK